MSYNFDRLEHGDAIDVNSVASAKELFRRWRKANGRENVRLVEDPDQEGRLFFVDDDAAEDEDV